MHERRLGLFQSDLPVLHALRVPAVRPFAVVLFLRRVRGGRKRRASNEPASSYVPADHTRAYYGHACRCSNPRSCSCNVHHVQWKHRRRHSGHFRLVVRKWRLRMRRRAVPVLQGQADTTVGPPAVVHNLWRQLPIDCQLSSLSPTVTSDRSQ